MDYRRSVRSCISSCSNNLTFLPHSRMKLLCRRKVRFDESMNDSLVEPQCGVFWVGFVISVNDFLSFTSDFLMRCAVSFHTISSYLLVGVGLNSLFAIAEA
jgi:hypothetical protein